LYTDKVTFFIGFSSLAAIVSAASYLLNRPVYYRFPVGIVLDNHATQSMAFALAIFSAGILLRFTPLSKKNFWLAAAAMAVMTTNLIFITPGRSGYLAFMVFGLVTVIVAVPGKIKYLLVLILPVLVGSLLMASPVARQKIELGLSEIAELDQAEKLSSMGIRMVMWKNTVGILNDQDFPLLTGYGTGGFREAYRPQVAGQTGWKAEVVADCHNQYLRIAVEHGAVGLLLFFGFMVACFRQRVSRPFKILGVGALLGWCATSLFSGHFGTALEGRLIFIWLGVMLAMPSAAPTGRQSTVIT
jgi:O-antigen ligase